MNHTGRKQADEVAKSLEDVTISAIYSSDLRRATDTALEIAKYHNLSVEIDPDFREMNQGNFEGLTFVEIRNSYSHLLSEWKINPESVRIPGGETLKEVQDRAWRGVRRIMGRHMNGTVVTVSHNFTIITLLCRFMGIELTNFHTFKIRAASKNVVLIRDGNFRVEIQDDTAHLSPELLVS